MTRVCIVGEDDVNLRQELLASETAREALSTYELARPFANSLAVETVSLGAAVALLNDLEWYLVRLAGEALVREPSISESEWLSRALATAVRDGAVAPADADGYLKVFGLADDELVEPLFVRRRDDGSVPEYDLRDVDETVVVRVTAEEFGA